MQAIRAVMNEDNQWIHLSMFSSRNQHPRTLDKLADYSAIKQENTDMITE